MHGKPYHILLLESRPHALRPENLTALELPSKHWRAMSTLTTWRSNECGIWQSNFTSIYLLFWGGVAKAQGQLQRLTCFKGIHKLKLPSASCHELAEAPPLPSKTSFSISVVLKRGRFLWPPVVTFSAAIQCKAPRCPIVCSHVVSNVPSGILAAFVSTPDQAA